MDGERAETSGGLIAAFDANRSELLRFLAARSGNPTEADDLLHELWIKLSAPHRAPIANARAYLFRMANNLVLDQRRAQQRAMARDRNWLVADGAGDVPPESRPDPTIPADEAMAERQEAAILHRAIAALPAGARRALMLYRFDGHGQAEIARIMGISRSGVEKHLAVAMKHLRNALCDCGYFATVASHEQGNVDGQTPHTGSEP